VVDIKGGEVRYIESEISCSPYTDKLFILPYTRVFIPPTVNNNSPIATNKVPVDL